MLTVSPPPSPNRSTYFQIKQSYGEPHFIKRAEVSQAKFSFKFYYKFAMSANFPVIDLFKICTIFDWTTKLQYSSYEFLYWGVTVSQLITNIIAKIYLNLLLFYFQSEKIKLSSLIESTIGWLFWFKTCQIRRVKSIIRVENLKFLVFLNVVHLYKQNLTMRFCFQERFQILFMFQVIIIYFGYIFVNFPFFLNVQKKLCILQFLRSVRFQIMCVCVFFLVGQLQNQFKQTSFVFFQLVTSYWVSNFSLSRIRGTALQFYARAYLIQNRCNDLQKVWKKDCIQKCSSQDVNNCKQCVVNMCLLNFQQRTKYIQYFQLLTFFLGDLDIC
eukprot:TRINITY_DN726_c0_g5_i1.p1 TRINITY_DN726_c0_g5~~TRINITY_DN726_c0_g5_i1.p1  ORF type:complete len:328 (+),score=-22.22 TRINITY_DN726_c0_g5_i1:1122-2105(+)